MEKFIKIESSISNICEIEVFLKRIFSKYEIDNKLYSNIYVSLNEAVNNAIQHGNKYDRTKFVKISFRDSNQFYEFIIEDEGSGFFIDNVKDPTLLKNRNNESGRGIFIMKNYSDNLEILESGKKIKLNFLKNRD
jgi:serine/threonine-protein kinase RsbW